MSNTCAHTHDHDHAQTPDARAARLEAAQVLCADSGERMTSSRLRTYELILEASGPIKAYDVIDRFHPEGAAKPNKKSAGKKTVLAPKYANPKNPAETWTGKGRKPGWFVAALAAGRTEDQLRIK